ncbi:MAG: efflux RND transporter periplasmic adaptor subunit [Propionibacteriaceae bacterium]|jgi:HlyD family secretion protein|nr:efflux RND transporter periplasmic adaptor subunit [Propionibacteriaceae bacterium]
MNRKAVIAGGVAVAVVAAAGGGVAYSQSNSAPLVGVAKAALATIATSVSASGTVAAGQSVGVYPPTAGTLGSLKVDDGDRVEKGDVIASLATTPLKLAVKQAQAALDAAYAQQEAVELGVPRAVDRSAASATLSAAQSAYSTAVKNYNAYNKEYKKADKKTKKSMLPTLRTMRTAKSQAAATVAQARSAISKLNVAAGVGDARAAAKSAIAAAKSSLSLAQKNLSKAKLTAPFDGVVTLAAGVEKGAAVAPGVPVVTLVNEAKMVFDAAVDETNIAAVAVDQSVEVTLDSASDTPFSGEVERVAASPTTTLTGSVAYQARISFDYGSTKVFEGMSGSVEIATAEVADAVSVPVESVVAGSDGKYVFVLDGETAKQTPVEVGAENDTSVQIVSGLSAGQQVVTTGATTLADGQKVRTA